VTSSWSFIRQLAYLFCSLLLRLVAIRITAVVVQHSSGPSES